MRQKRRHHSRAAYLKTVDLEILVDGNSIPAADNNAGINQYFAKAMRTILIPFFKSVTIFSKALSGQNFEEMLADCEADVFANASVNKKTFLFAGEAENGPLGDLFTAEENFDFAVDYFNRAHTYPIDVKVLFTGGFPKRMPGFTSGNSWRLWALGSQQFITLTQTVEVHDENEDFFNEVDGTPLATAPWDYHMKVRDFPELGGPRDSLINTVLQKDYLHLEKAGVDRMAQRGAAICLQKA